VIPGQVVNDVINALATKVIEKEFPLHYSADEYLKYLENAVNSLQLSRTMGPMKDGLFNLDNLEKLRIWASYQRKHEILLGKESLNTQKHEKNKVY
jgi:hypothetical protein